MKNFFLKIYLIVLSVFVAGFCFGEDVDFNAPHTIITIPAQATPGQISQTATDLKTQELKQNADGITDTAQALTTTANAGPALTKNEKYYNYGEKLFAAGNYAEAVRYFYAILKTENNNIKAWKKTAFCYYKLNKHNYAYGAFQRVLKYDKKDKDAIEFMEFYQSLKDKKNKVKEKREPINSVWRSAVIPGFGQIYNGQIAKGILVGSAFIVSTALTIYNVSDEKVKYAKYKKANDNQEIAFKQAQEAWTSALIWGILAGAVYAGNIIDAGLSYNCDEAQFAGIQVKENAVYLAAGYRW